MDTLLDDALETLTLMFTELVQMVRALPKPDLTGSELIARARVVVAIISVGAALRRMSPRPKATANPAVAMANLISRVGAAAAV
jgi:hypothetical protein